MSDLMSKFNQGGVTSTDIEREFHPEAVSKAIIEMNKRKVFFSKHNNYEAMMEHHGDTLTKIVHIPVLNRDNLSDANIDAKTATLLKNTYKIVKEATGEVTGIYPAEKYLKKDGSNTMDEARAAAKAAAENDAGAGEKVFSTPGAILGGEASYALQSGDIAPLPEEGGVVNLLNATNKLVSAKVTKHGVGLKYTVDSLKKGSLIRTVAKHISDVARAVGEMREIQSMVNCVTAAANNAIIASDSHVTRAEMTCLDVVDYDTLTALEQELYKYDVPLDTTILDGSTNIDTKVVNDTFIMYIGRELVPTIRKIKGPDGKIAYTPLAQYKAGLDRKVLQGELGTVGQFTFCVDMDLIAYRGAGVEVGGGDDDGTAAEQANRLATTRDSGDGTMKTYYDVFPMVVVGDDSFVETGFTYQNVKARHIMPKADVYNDMHAEVGGVSAKWSYGFLPYRPERIRCVETLSTKV